MWNWPLMQRRLAERSLLVRALLATTSALSFAACSPDSGTAEDPADAFRSPLGYMEPEPQRPGSPAAGYDALVNKAYVTCGIPYAAYKRSGSFPAAERRLPGRTGRNAELPYYLTAHVSSSGVEVVAFNCLTCHAAEFNGRLIVGLGDESRDFTRDARTVAEGVGIHVAGAAETAEWRKWADRMGAIAPYIRTDTVGVNPAVNLTWALFAHRDATTLAWSDEPLIEPPPEKPLPVSVPPWWRMKKKNTMFYTAAGRGDHARAMILASTLCTDSVEEARAIDSYAPDIRAYLTALEPPKYPLGIDWRLADQGRGVFQQHCSACHGTYGADATYPNLVIALDVVGTDPALAQTAVSGEEDRFFRWMAQSFYGENSRLAPAPGYVAPPLDGVWATAPYLHNGSVPTIAALLESAKRPKYWLRSFESRDFDPHTLGWTYVERPYGKAGAADAHERRRIYDTTLPGYSNQGHTFGDVLTDAERAAVLEYLKTL